MKKPSPVLAYKVPQARVTSPGGKFRGKQDLARAPELEGFPFADPRFGDTFRWDNTQYHIDEIKRAAEGEIMVRGRDNSSAIFVTVRPAKENKPSSVMVVKGFRHEDTYQAELDELAKIQIPYTGSEGQGGKKSAAWSKSFGELEGLRRSEPKAGTS